MQTTWSLLNLRVHSMSDNIEVWEVHYDDDVPRWRVVTLHNNVIVAERTFHDEEIAREYVNTIKGDV